MNDNANLTQKPDDGQVAKVNGPARNADQAVLRPPVDVIEDANGIMLIADLPGVSKDKLNLQLETHSLTIEGEMDINIPQEMDSRYAEVQVPRYKRTFTLSKELNGENATAELKNGVLKLRIPKAAHAQPRRIEIQAG